MPSATVPLPLHDALPIFEATPAILEHRPSAVEVMDRFILDNTKQNASLDRLRRTFIDGDPGALLCVEFYADRPEDLPPRLDARSEEHTSELQSPCNLVCRRPLSLFPYTTLFRSSRRRRPFSNTARQRSR